MKIRDRIKELRRVPASELAPNPKNWRTHPKEQLDALRGVLAEVGYAGAALARELPDGTLQLIDGHARTEISGDAVVPVLVLDVTEAEADILLATFDPLGAMAGADAGKLDDLLKSVSSDNDAINAMLSQLATDNGLIDATPEPGAGGDEFDATPEASGPTRTQPGDMWLIGGKHRLLVGDCTDAESVLVLMDGKKAECVFTDPPYGVNIKGGKNNTTIAGDITQTAIPFSFEVACTHATTEDARLYFCGGEGNIGLYGKLYERHCRQLPRHLIWVKNGFVMKPNGYHNGYEIIFHGYKPGGGGLNKWFGERTEDEASDVWKINRDSSSTYEHPTQKPIALPSRAIKNSCQPGGIVFEPFAGSGSTLIAAHRLGRICYGMEIEPRYGDVILKRAEAEGLICERVEQ